MLIRLKTLPLQIWILGLISLLNDGASDLIYPLLPLYLSQVLKAGPGILGIMEGLSKAMVRPLKLVSGVSADLRKKHSTAMHWLHSADL